jgi:hypothetical protein
VKPKTVWPEPEFAKRNKPQQMSLKNSKVKVCQQVQGTQMRLENAFKARGPQLSWFGNRNNERIMAR